MKKARKARREYLDALKNVPCMDCGQKFPPYVMDLDHRDPNEKVDKVSTIIKQGWDAFLLEVEKCDIVCANCHRIRTHTRKDYLS